MLKSSPKLRTALVLSDGNFPPAAATTTTFTTSCAITCWIFPSYFSPPPPALIKLPLMTDIPRTRPRAARWQPRGERSRAEPSRAETAGARQRSSPAPSARGSRPAGKAAVT